MSAYILKKKTETELKKITDEVVLRILENEHLKINKIILYGSYARGDADEESDIDIMVLCENNQDEANEYAMDIFRRADKVAFDNDIMIQTDVENKNYFENWVEDMPFFRNVRDDGVLLYG